MNEGILNALIVEFIDADVVVIDVEADKKLAVVETITLTRD